MYDNSSQVQMTSSMLPTLSIVKGKWWEIKMRSLSHQTHINQSLYIIHLPLPPPIHFNKEGKKPERIRDWKKNKKNKKKMEGLIPVVYKSLKKNKTKRQYECLSSGAAQAYNIEDFYMKDDHDHHDYFSRKQYLMPDAGTAPGLHGAHHRRYNSVQVDHLRSFASEDDAYKPKQLVRFRSHRMFLCLTGA